MTNLQKLQSLCDEATWDCLCGLPGCKPCKASSDLELASRQALPKLIEIVLETRAALEFYSNRDNWFDCTIDKSDFNKSAYSRKEINEYKKAGVGCGCAGKTARQALTKTDKMISELL